MPQGYWLSHLRFRWWHGTQAFLARLRLEIVDMTDRWAQNLQPPMGEAQLSTQRPILYIQPAAIELRCRLTIVMEQLIS